MSLIRKLRRRAKYYAIERMGYAAQEAFGGNLLTAFTQKCKTMPAPRILELGAKRSIADRSTVHKDWVPHSAEFLGSDIEPAEDVDVLADVHRLSEFVGAESFDAIISCSSFEHFKYPHLAAHEIMKTLKVGGALFIQTHQSYPLHSSPFDYFRFSREAMAGLFGTKMGFNVIGTDYEFPVRLRAKEAPDIAFMPAYINVRLFGEKTAPTPAQYIYEFDTSL